MTALASGVLSDVGLIVAYADVLGEIAVESKRPIETQLDVLECARTSAEQAIARCHAACELAERWALFAARALAGTADPSAVAEAAAVIRSLLGGGS